MVSSAEDSYRKGRRALTAGRVKEALAMFEAAIEIERRRSPARPQPRYLSYYGLCLSLRGESQDEAVRCCREAVTLDGFDPSIRCNLGQVLLMAGRRRDAHRCFTKSLRLEPRLAAAQRALSFMGARRRPTLPFLARSNPINVYLGKLRGAG